ncbi:hypothetical protein EVG20_g4996 [Dentipellis fragilis]|uniref:Uncharacterized protein n=1 Tax=Dentipellis fragilis TaxID=205917 RepID=A0A4Y9YUI6_9AGAM|nr:hypothetical protein EVG20_g4996 [Dentipellis fragilis]
MSGRWWAAAKLDDLSSSCSRVLRDSETPCSYYKIIPSNILVPLSFFIMSNWSLDSQDASVLYSAADSGLTISSSPAPINKREGVFQSRTTSPAKQKRRQSARLPKYPAVIAAQDPRAEEEWRKLQMEWECYPWQARPKSRREELQKLPALCNDFESFDKQMARVDRRPDDPGLLPQIRAFMNERARSLERQEEEAQRQKYWESISRTIQGIEEYDQEVDKRGKKIRQSAQDVRDFGQDVDKHSQMGQYLAHRVDNAAYEVREYGVSRAPPRQRIHHLGGAGRNNF